MAARQTPRTSKLTADDISAVYERVGPAERKLIRELLATDEPSQAIVLAEMFHYFPGAHLVDDKPAEPVKRTGAPLTAVVADMFPELENL